MAEYEGRVVAGLNVEPAQVDGRIGRLQLLYLAEGRFDQVDRQRRVADRADLFLALADRVVGEVRQ
jgi:hypothetical protein